jgi:hypothetical protein
MGFLNSLFQGTGKLSVAIYDTHQEAPLNTPYRVKNDHDNVIRIRQNYIVDSREKWDTLDEHWGLHVAGVTYREEDVISFIEGEDWQIEVLREPTDKHPHAIAVYGIWKSRGKRYKKQLGYVPNQDAKDIYKQIKKLSQYQLAAKLHAMYIPTKDKNAGLLIDIIVMEPRWPRFEIHGLGKKSGRKRKKTYRAQTFEDALEMAYADDMIVDLQACKEV